MVKRITTPASVSDATIKSETAAPAPSPAAPAADIDAVLHDLDKSAAATAGAAQRAEDKQARQEVDTVEAGILKLLGLIAQPAQMAMTWLTAEQFEQLWGKNFQRSVAGPAAEIARDLNFDMSGTLSKIGPYVALAVATVPPAYVTFKVHRQAKAYYAEQAANGGQPASVKATDGSAST